MSTSKNKKRGDLIPKHFQSPEEAGQFWDTHDSADYEKNMVDVKCEIDIKRRTFLVPLDRDLYRKVQSIARKKGVSAETLLNMWILEKAS
jgi:CopG antitoxin of type II toxin-antitoxin system